MDVNLARDARPGLGRDHQCENDAGHPLHQHQPYKQPIRVFENLPLMRLKQLVRPGTEDVVYSEHLALSAAAHLLANAQPNTDVSLRSARPLWRSDAIADSPALLPACPRDAVIPPLKRSCPSAAKSSVCPDVSAPNRR